MLYPTVHPVLLYHGQDGQYDRIQLSIYICFILLSIPSYCTMDRMDSTIESNCLYTYALSYCPSCPIVPWTRWTVRWNPTVYIHMLYPTVHPVLLYHGQDGRYNGIQLSIYICFILLSILSYCTMDRMDSTMESNCLCICVILLSIPSYCTMDRMDV